MFIFFLFSREEKGMPIPEWGIVELQGDLEIRGDEELSDQFIGDLHYTKNGQPVFINMHILKYNHLIIIKLHEFTDFNHWSSYSTW